MNVDREFVGLNVEARIEDADVTAENADSLLGIERGFISVNLGRDRLAIGIGRRKGGR